MIRDLALIKGQDGIYDISFSRGDYELVEGLQTAIWMSIFCEKRDVEVIDWQAQRGWVGDQLNNDGFQIGSLLWTVNQSKLNDETIIEVESIIEDCLQWLLDQNYAREIDISIKKNLDNTGLIANITISRNDNIQENLSFDLWNKTIIK